MTRKRVFAAGLSTETNSFSPIPTSFDDFERVEGDAWSEEWARAFYGTAFAAFEEIARQRGYAYVQGPFASATPSGLTTDDAYARLRSWLLEALEVVLPVDGVLLNLHGAMATPSLDDCEADLVGAIRQAAGVGPRIGVLLDLHCDVSEALLRDADVVVTLKEYPHVDGDARARELAGITLRAADGEVAPAMATFDCRTAGLAPTTTEPMRSFVDQVLHGAELHEGVLSASLAHGFPWADTAAYGSRALVVTDGDPALAARLAEEVGRAFYVIRREAIARPIPVEEALARAAALPGPVVIADVADNAGGGAPSDSTFVLKALLDGGLDGAALGPLWDPLVVRTAFAAGVGATVQVRLGGKATPASGDPLDVEATVLALRPELRQMWPQEDGVIEVPAGDCAALGVDGVAVVVSSLRDQAVGLNLFTDLSIDVASQRLVVVKSAHHYRAAFGAVASEMISVDTPGALRQDLTALTFTRADRDRYPWIDDPLGTG